MKAVVGLGFGDEGKGRVVDWLCSNTSNPMVLRFSGGPQAAHQVVLPDGSSHVHSSFGSGTLRGAPTVWSKHCPLNPIALENEYHDLVRKGFSPKLYISPLSPVITPYELRRNNYDGDNKYHGTCGAGIFATKVREDNHQQLHAVHLFHPSILTMKLDLLKDYYYKHYSDKWFKWDNITLDDFLESCKFMQSCSDIQLSNSQEWIDPADIIMEGAQGILLDQNMGFFPHVTPANTGTRNVWEFQPEVYLVTRAYQTRHGNGPMSPVIDHNIRANPMEKNTDDGPQGEFRRTLLDLDLVRYAVYADEYIRSVEPKLVITCMDLVKNEHRLFDGGEIIQCVDEDEFIQRIARAANTTKVFTSSSVSGDIQPYMGIWKH